VATESKKAASAPNLNGLDRIIVILDALSALPGGTLTSIARATGLSEPTTHRYLGALREHKLVYKDAETGTYSLGIKLFELGHSALRGFDPRSVARPHLESLRDRFGETSVMAMNDDGRLVVIAAAQAFHGVAMGAKVGEPDFWHSTSLGRAILAELDPVEAAGILGATELTAFTSRTLSDPADILSSLKRVQSQGYAIDDEESEIGLRCVGAAVHDAHGRPTFAISVSGPTYRMTPAMVPEIAQAVSETAKSLSRELGWQGAPTAEAALSS